MKNRPEGAQASTVSVGVKSLIFLDFDDLMVINKKYGARDAVSDAPKPPDFHRQIFHAPTVEFLNYLVEKYDLQIVLTTSWLSRLDRNEMSELLSPAGLGAIDNVLHREWSAMGSAE